MQADIAIFTSEPEADWISDARIELARAGDLRVAVVAEGHRSSVGAYRAVIVDAGGVDNALLLIRHCHRSQPHTMIFMVSTEPPQWEDTRSAFRAGATDVLPKDRIDIIAQRISARPTVLLADNKEDFRETWGEFLRDEGYEVVMASSPAEAKDRIRHGVDLAILDVRLLDDRDERDFSGFEVARTAPSSLPIIIATNHPTTEMVKQALRPRLNGNRAAAEFHHKHEPEDKLLDVVKKMLPLPYKTSTVSRDDEIAQLYEKLADLQMRRDQAPADSGLEQELKVTFKHLRKLQKQEAAEFRAAAEARLLMPLDEGQRLLDQASQLLNENETSTP